MYMQLAMKMKMHMRILRQLHHLWEGIPALCYAKNNMFCRVSGSERKMAHFGCFQSPVSKNECMHHSGNSVNFVSDLLFLCAFHASCSFVCKISFPFFEKCSPPSVGSMIFKAHKSKIMKHVHFRPSSWARMHPFSTNVCAQEI